jgi:pre-mRNA-splicing factor SYF1
MLRIKRSVLAIQGINANFVAIGSNQPDPVPEQPQNNERADAMEALEREAKAPIGFVASSDGVLGMP